MMNMKRSFNPFASQAKADREEQAAHNRDETPEMMSPRNGSLRGSKARGSRKKPFINIVDTGSKDEEGGGGRSTKKMNTGTKPPIQRPSHKTSLTLSSHHAAQHADDAMHR